MSAEMPSPTESHDSVHFSSKLTPSEILLEEPDQNLPGHIESGFVVKREWGGEDAPEGEPEVFDVAFDTLDDPTRSKNTFVMRSSKGVGVIDQGALTWYPEGGDEPAKTVDLKALFDNRDAPPIITLGEQWGAFAEFGDIDEVTELEPGGYFASQPEDEPAQQLQEVVPSDEIDSNTVHTIEAMYLYGATKDEMLQQGVTQAQLDTWWNALNDHQREDMRMGRDRGIRQAEQIHRFNKEYPEFAEGRIPAEQEADLLRSYPEYAVGFNQSNSVTEVDEAEELLEDNGGGIELGIYGIKNRFTVHDRRAPIEGLSLGYYGPETGRFVYAFPLSEAVDNATSTATSRFDNNDGRGPDDLFLASSEGELVSAKYCAGFIDDEGVYHKNYNFLKSPEPDFDEEIPDVSVPVPDARPESGLTPEQEERKQMQTKIILAADVAQKDGKTSGDITKIADHMEVNTRAFIRDMHTKAAEKGRPLSDIEKERAKGLIQVVKTQRRIAEVLRAREEGIR